MIQDFLKILEEESSKIKKSPELEEVGEVVSVGEGVVKASGLFNVLNSEIVKIEGEKEIYGVAINLEEDEVGIMIFDSPKLIKEGDLVKRTKRVLSLGVSDELIGRIINPLGEPLDGKDPIKADKYMLIERKGPSVIEREPVNTPLHTGIKAIDSMIPIGRGQRELILGDRTTGKTSIVIDTIINQKHEENKPVCIYVAIGQKRAKIARIIDVLKREGAMSWTIIVSASASDPAPLLYLAPFAGCAIGEYFMEKGRDALVIYDDLTKHAWAWRQISLLLRRPPGREAYPGDIFYLHSRLLERAAKLSEENGGGSLTALPIIETQEGDISSYIPTNVISITDGQIYLDSQIFARGQLPAINIGLSVSRVGSAAQTKAMKQYAASLRLNLAQFRELETFVEFAGEVDEATRERIARGRRLMEILKQDEEKPVPFEKAVCIIFAGVKGFLDQIKIEDIKRFEEKLFENIEVLKPELLKKIKESKEIDEETREELQKIIVETRKLFL